MPWTGNATCTVKLPDGSTKSVYASCNGEATESDAKVTLQLSIDEQVNALDGKKQGSVSFSITKIIGG